MPLHIRPAAKWFGASVFGAGLILSMIALTLTLKFGSLGTGLAYLRGERLVFVPQTLEIGSGDENERRDYRLQLVNLSDRPIKIFGARANCGCIVVTDELPLEVPGHGSRLLAGTITFTGQGDDLSHSITVYSDLPQGGIASAAIKGHIRRATRPPAKP